MADTVRINGNLYDQGSTSLKVADEFIYGYNAVSWAHKRDRQLFTGAGQDRAPKGRTRGKYVPETLKVTCRRDSASYVKTLLAARASDGVSYGNPSDVPVVFQYVEDESNQLPVTVTFVDCALIGDNGNSEEDGPDMTELEFSVMRIEETIDGKTVTLYDSAGLL